jgi:hypothetical protein
MIEQLNLPLAVSLRDLSEVSTGRCPPDKVVPMFLAFFLL